MGYDLRSGLDAVADRAPVPAEPLVPEPVLARARRGRALRGLTVAGTAAVVVTGLAVTVQAAPWRDAPVPPALTETSTPAPSPEQSPPPRPEPTAEARATDEPTTPDGSGPEPAVAVTSAGDVVLLDSVDGTVVRTVAEGVVEPGAAPGVSVTPDRTAVYLGRTGDDVPWPGEVVRVSLEDGSVEKIASGYAPAVSPDGTTLAYLTVDAGAEGADEVRSVVLHDLHAGTAHRIVDDACVGCERVVGAPAWSPDGGTVYVPTGWWDSPFTDEVVALELDTDPVSIQDGRTVGPADGDPGQTTSGEGWYTVKALPDGRLLVGGERAPADAPEEWDPVGDTSWTDDEAFLAVVDPATGVASDQVVRPDRAFGSIAAGAQGDAVLVIERRFVEASGESDGGPRFDSVLVRWEPATGAVTEIAEDVVSIA